MSYREEYTVDGNTVRKEKRVYREERRNNPPKYKASARTKKNQLVLSPLYAIEVVCGIMVMAVVAMFYVSLQSEVTSLREEKGQLISEYEELKVSNDLYHENMMGAIDLKEIERIAVEELGMKMAGNGQVITYSDELDDYVKQYMDVPN